MLWHLADVDRRLTFAFALCATLPAALSAQWAAPSQSQSQWGQQGECPTTLPQQEYQACLEQVPSTRSTVTLPVCSLTMPQQDYQACQARRVAIRRQHRQPTETARSDGGPTITTGNPTVEQRGETITGGWRPGQSQWSNGASSEPTIVSGQPTVTTAKPLEGAWQPGQSQWSNASPPAGSAQTIQTGQPTVTTNQPRVDGTWQPGQSQWGNQTSTAATNTQVFSATTNPPDVPAPQPMGRLPTPIENIANGPPPPSPVPPPSNNGPSWQPGQSQWGNQDTEQPRQPVAPVQGGGRNDTLGTGAQQPATGNQLGTPRLLAPTNLRELAPTIPLEWSSVLGATYYELAVRDLTTNAFVVDQPVYNTVFHRAPYPNGRTFRWTVRACNQSGCGGWSTPGQFRTAAATQSDSCRIEVRFKSVPHANGVVNHAFIVTSDSNSTTYFRGGPEGGSGGNSPSENRPFGKIVTESGSYTPGTIDWTTSLTGRQIVDNLPYNCDNIERLLGRAITDIERAGLPYDPVIRNSNSVAREALERSGYSSVRPVVVAPAWNTQLP